jgi:hypothetical protein
MGKRREAKMGKRRNAEISKGQRVGTSQRQNRSATESSSTWVPPHRVRSVEIENPHVAERSVRQPTDSVVYAKGVLK